MSNDAKDVVGDATGTQRVRLGLVFSSADTEHVSELLLLLTGRVDFVEDGPVDGVLVVVSQAAIGDEDWLTQLQRHASDHLVPLKIGTVKGLFGF